MQEQPSAEAAPGVTASGNLRALVCLISFFIACVWRIKIYLYITIFIDSCQSFFIAFLIGRGHNLLMGERKIFSNRIDEDLIASLKHLAIDRKESLGLLLEEAIRDLLKKHEPKTPKKPKP